MLDNNNITNIIIAIVSGGLPGLFALRQTRRTKKSVELAGSEVTVSNWNKLIKNLYGEIERLTLVNEQDRKRAITREAELEAEIEATRLKAATEKRELLDEIGRLRTTVVDLEARVRKALAKEMGDTRPGV